MIKLKLRSLPVVILAGLLVGCAGAATPAPTAAVPSATTVSSLLETARQSLHWFDVSSVLYHGIKNIYFDPITLEGNLPVADVILVSHGHSDHWSIPDIQKIIGPDTILVVSPNIAPESLDVFPGLGFPITVIHEEETLDVNGVSIEGIAAYGYGHPRESGGLGYLVTVDGLTLYFAGGTSFYPEMAEIQSDIALYPMNQKADVERVIEVLPAKLMILLHTSAVGADSFAKVFSGAFPQMQFTALEKGPYQP